MADGKHVLRRSYSCIRGDGSSGGGSSSGRSKMVKLKKVPQRGLGVAQLEKIRLEEQQKQDAIGSNTDTIPSLAVAYSNFKPCFSTSPNSIPLPPSSPTDFPSPHVLYRHAPPVPTTENLHQSSVSKSLNVNGGEIGLKGISTSRYGNWPTFGNAEYKFEGENQRLDNHGFAFGSRVNLSYESNASVVPLPGVLQRSHQFQQPASSSMVNASSGVTSSSILSSQMELPSNQTFHSNNYTTLQPDEDKLVGMKRSYPFSLESPPASSVPYKPHSTNAASISKSAEFAPYRNQSTVHQEQRNKYFRGGPSNSSPLPERNPSEVMIMDNGKLNGDFLTLAPPEAASPLLNLNHKHPLGYSGHQGRELSDFERISHQVCSKHPQNSKSLMHEQGPSGSMGQPSYNFFSVKLHTNQITTHASNDDGETIDLSLKL